MKKSFINTMILALSFILCSGTWLLAQTAQPQNTLQNTAPIHNGTNPNPNGSQPNSMSPNSTPANSPGNNGTGNKSTNGNYGTPNPNGTNEHPRSGSTGATGSTGPSHPATPVGPPPSRSPQ